jgi:hypothetical protein
VKSPCTENSAAQMDFVTVFSHVVVQGSIAREMCMTRRKRDPQRKERCRIMTE